MQTIPKSQYFYVLHGDMSMPLACRAYRQTRRTTAQTGCRKAVKCPCCNARLMDIDEKVRVDLYRQPVENNLKCQGYIKCQKCKDEVGIIMVA